MVVCGATSGADSDIDIRSLYQHHRQILGAPIWTRREFRDVGRLVGSDDLEPRVDQVLPMDGIPESHRTLEDRNVMGKIVIRPND